MQLVVRHLSGLRATDGDVLQLRTTVAESDHRLTAGLAPLDGATDLLGDDAEQQLLAVGTDLGAESAAHVGGAHANQ